MTQDRHWDKRTNDEPEAIWEEQQENLCLDDSDVDEDEEQELLVTQLAPGQSLTVIWENDEPFYAFEEVVLCTGCGEALTELRLALYDPESQRCAVCGVPPLA